MNNLRKLYGFIFVAAIIVCAMAACDLLLPPDSDFPDTTPTPPTTTVTGIVVTPPTKTQYNLGEELDTTGMVVTATYSDGSSVAVSGYATNGYVKTTLGNQTITVTYSDKTASFTVNVIDPIKSTIATPTANPTAGTYNSAQSVSLSCATENATIYYTTNGSNPTETSNKYSGAISISVTTTLKAIAVKEDMNNSGILTAAYTVTTAVFAPPTGVTATPASSISITVNWSPVTGATGYKVYRNTSSSGAYSHVGTLASTSYTDSGLSANTTYYYKVSATNSAGESAQSSPVSATTPSVYDIFNKADYVIVNETGRPDSAPEIAWLKELTWFMYAVNEQVGDWMANYVKTNKIKTILSDGDYGWAWIYPNQLDRLYLGVDGFFQLYGYDYNYDFKEVPQRGPFYEFVTHETMHLVQNKSDYVKLMTGMRPDICAAADMLMEFLAWFYTETRYPGTVITTDMANAVETQSKYMILSTDPWAYDDARAKDPSLPPLILHGPWFNNEVSAYAQHAFTWTLVRESAMTAPLRQASKEDILRVARALLACRDPKQAGVTDEALWTVFDALRKVATGESKYLNFGDYRLSRESFNNFQSIIANWDKSYSAQGSRSVYTLVVIQNHLPEVWR